jgi:serine/threonine protein kinase
VFSLEEDYDVHEVLGRGGFGIVRRACLRTGGPPCAVKSIRKLNWHTEELAHNEARILKCLSHAAINKLLNVCEDAEHIHLVLELASGHELFDEIADRIPLRETRAACIMKQMLAALQYCHEIQRSVIHRDIKPENIMINDCIGDNVLEVKLIDWGLAIVCEDVVQTPIVGTPCYLAPESLQDGMYSRASDMWSAGAVLHMLLTGGELPEQFGATKNNLLQGLGISEAALSFLRGLLSSASCQRLTAQDACRNEWVCGQTSDAVATYASSCDVSPRGQESPSTPLVNTQSDKILADLKHPPALTENQQQNQLGISSFDVTCRCDGEFMIFDDFKHDGPLSKHKINEVATPDKRKNGKPRSRKMEQCKENSSLGEKTCSWQQKTKLLSNKPDRNIMQSRPLLLR